MTNFKAFKHINFESFKRVGVAFTASLIATAPLFSTILAIIFLSEKLNLLVGLGTFFIIFGVFFLSWFRPKKHIRLLDLSFALGGAAMIGTATVISKFGLNISNIPISGIAIATTAGVITQLIFIIALKKWDALSKNFYEAKFFIIAGISVSIALIILFLALSVGEVIIVFPLNTTQALFALLFAWILLRKQDHVSKYTVLGAVAIVLGSSLVTIGV